MPANDRDDFPLAMGVGMIIVGVPLFAIAGIVHWFAGGDGEFMMTFVRVVGVLVTAMVGFCLVAWITASAYTVWTGHPPKWWSA